MEDSLPIFQFYPFHASLKMRNLFLNLHELDGLLRGWLNTRESSLYVKVHSNNILFHCSYSRSRLSFQNPIP